MARYVYGYIWLFGVQPNGSGTWLDYENNMKWRGGGSCSSMKVNVFGSSSSICLPGLLGDNCDEHAYPHTFSHCKHPLNSSRGAPGSRSEMGVVGMHFKSPKGSRPEQSCCFRRKFEKMREIPKKSRLICGNFGYQKNNFESSFFEKKCPV